MNQSVKLKELLSNGNAVVSGNHFIYKSGKHGSEYIDKEQFAFIGARNFAQVIRDIGRQAIASGFRFPVAQEIGIIGPAEGATLLPAILAEFFEKECSELLSTQAFNPKFFPAKTSLDENGNHYIKEKLIPYYKGKPFIIFEDIVNGGTTIREVGDLLRNQLKSEVVAALCFVDRGGQTISSLNIPQYFPGLWVSMEQYTAATCPYCSQGIPINTVLGKGRKWVDLFGQPPYEKGVDFSVLFNQN